MTRGCLTTLSFFATVILVWVALLVYFFATEPPGLNDGGYEMGIGMFMITGGLVIAAVLAALVALLVWTRSGPREP